MRLFNPHISAAEALLLVFAAGGLVLRFAYLEISPPGFFIDEAGGAGLIECIRERQTCYYEWDKRFPLFCSGPAGGMWPPTYLYFGAVWTFLFGNSIQSFRAIAAFFSVLTIIGLALIARRLLGGRYAVVVLFCAALSPWSFHFSRIAWNPPLMTCALVWGYYFLLRSPRLRDAAYAGLCLALAMYSYSAAMIQVVLMAPVLWAFELRRGRPVFARFLTFGAVGTAVCVPLIFYTLSQAGQQRFTQVSILAPAYFAGHLGSSVWLAGKEFLHNFSLYFNPVFLFVQGDALVRHSVLGFGHLSYVDLLALIFVPAAVWTAVLPPRANPALRAAAAKTAAFAALGILTAISPSALTWDCQPHALRALGAWPFWALLSGLSLHLVLERWRRACVLVLAAAAVFSGLYLRTYFTRYPADAAWWFDVDTAVRARSAGAAEDWESFVLQQEGSSAVFYLAHYADHTCSSAREFILQAQRDNR